MTTWADGHGRWYARVRGDETAPRRKARNLIRRELAERDALRYGHAVRIEVAPVEWQTDDQSITYRERF